MQIYTDLCTRINKNINIHSFVNQNHYEYICTASCVLWSVWIVTYMVLCLRINMHSNAHFCAPESIQVHRDLCTRNSKYSIVHLMQYEYRCTQSCVWGSIKVGTYAVLFATINMNRSLDSVLHQNQYEYSCVLS